MDISTANACASTAPFEWRRGNTQPMTSADLLEWHDFFAVLAEVGSTLAGLLFVGLTISLGHVLQARGYLARVFGAFFLLFESVLIGMFGLLPRQSPFALGLEFVFVSLAILAGTQAFSRAFPEDHSTVLGSIRMHRFRKIGRAHV